MTATPNCCRLLELTLERCRKFRDTATVPSSAPTAEFQLEFLTNIERVLARGKFTSTYKFALLIALTNIAVERGNDTNDELDIDLDEVARQFLELYWSMARPYPHANNTILKQATNSKKPATMITLLQEEVQDPQSGFRRLRIYRAKRGELLRQTRATLTKDVLHRLQTIAGGTQTRNEFLYAYPSTGDARARRSSITLKPGAAACLRRMRGVILAMVQARWALFVRENNEQLSADSTLEPFLFGANRSAVSVYATRFYELQEGRCFYSGDKLHAHTSGEVDHFIAWARYPFDSPFNLVLASRAANNKKRDQLAPLEFKTRWLARNSDADNFARLTMPAPDGFGAAAADRDTAHKIAQWAYRAP